MTLIEWNENLSVGVVAVDLQHQKIFELINQNHSAMIEGRFDEQVGYTLNSLIDYTKNHLAWEEEIFDRFGYPEVEAHKVAHKALTDKVMSYKERYDNGEKILGVEMLGFLKDWLVGHIISVDRRYTPFFLEHGIT
jgi:hemerythrin-like metal-binding protein